MMKTLRVVGCVFACALAVGVGWAAEDVESPGTILDDAALIVIDIQNFYFPEGFVPLTGPENAASQAAKVIDIFRKAGRPVIHVQHLPKDVDTPNATGIQAQYRIHQDVRPIPGEKLIGKHHANSFRETELLGVLRELKATKVVVVGMQTHMCVEAAVRAAADYGFDVSVVHDACATRDLEFEGSTVPAAQVHAAALAAMSGSYATVVSTDDLAEVTK